MALVGHDVDDSGYRPVVDRKHNRGHGRVQVGDDDGHPVDRIGFAQEVVVLGALLVGTGNHGL